MRKHFIICLSLVMLLCLSACAKKGSETPNISVEKQSTEAKSLDAKATQAPAQKVAIKESPDKYTAYLKDYTGRNCASVGYEAISGRRMDRLGNGTVELCILNENGTYLEPNDETLKNYVVVAQNYPPNTEIKFTYLTDSKGNEYDNLVAWQTIDEVVLKVREVGDNSTTKDAEMTPIIARPDKYTAYVKDYVGRNLFNCGYVSLGDDLRDEYGAATILLKAFNEEGSYIGTDEEDLKDYVVVAQNCPPNTEIKYTYMKDGDGKEYDNLTDWVNVEEIVLKVCKVGNNQRADTGEMTQINVSPDKYSSFIKDYTGRNLLNCGYISLGGDLRDEYGAANVRLEISAQDGSFVEIEEESLKNYAVVDQNPAPNTEIKWEFSKDKDGNEYNFTNWQSIEEIDLYVVRISAEEELSTDQTEDVVPEEPVKTDFDEAAASPASDGEIRPSIKEAIDSYETFVDEYCAFMQNYDMTDFSKLSDYMNMLEKEAEMAEKFEAIEDEELTLAESVYYSEVSLRCANKLLKAASTIG